MSDIYEIVATQDGTPGGETAVFKRAKFATSFDTWKVIRLRSDSSMVIFSYRIRTDAGGAVNVKLLESLDWLTDVVTADCDNVVDPFTVNADGLLPNTHKDRCAQTVFLAIKSAVDGETVNVDAMLLGTR